MSIRSSGCSIPIDMRTNDGVHARELVALYPTDMQLRLLVLDLEKRQAH